MLYMLLPESLLESRSLTWAAWSPSGQHPMLYRSRDIGPALFDKMRSNPHCRWMDGVKSVCYLFARKFHPDSLEKLLEDSPSVGHVSSLAPRISSNDKDIASAMEAAMVWSSTGNSSALDVTKKTREGIPYHRNAWQSVFPCLRQAPPFH